MTIITSTCDLPGGWFKMYTVKDSAEAEKITAGCTAYLYKSKVIDALYLFVQVNDAT